MTTTMENNPTNPNTESSSASSGNGGYSPNLFIAQWIASLDEHERRISELEKLLTNETGCLASSGKELEACNARLNELANKLSDMATRAEVEQLAQGFHEISNTLVAIASVLDVSSPPT